MCNPHHTNQFCKNELQYCLAGGGLLGKTQVHFHIENRQGFKIAFKRWHPSPYKSVFKDELGLI
jgi:hypothetical protein